MGESAAELRQEIEQTPGIPPKRGGIIYEEW
jgi:hypothetical protein